MNKFIIPVIIYLLLVSGCATAPVSRQSQAVYINGFDYYPLIPLCENKSINWQYDSFSRVMNLNKDSHRIALRVGDNLVLIDGLAKELNTSVDYYNGYIVIPRSLKESIDALFKDSIIAIDTAFRITQIKKIVIDAGHGGNDPGAIGRSGLREKEVNLDISRRLAKILKNSGMEVIMTRSSDIYVPLERRVEIANKSAADLFVSIHSNANRSKNMNGFEVYYVSNSVSDSQRAQASVRNMPVRFDSSLFSGNSSNLRAIVWDLIYTSSRAESIELSRSICYAVEENMDSRVIGVKAARFQVLKGAFMPAILVEVGFLSNSSEEKLLRNGFYRQKIAEAIATGIAKYSRDAELIDIVRK